MGYYLLDHRNVKASNGKFHGREASAEKRVAVLHTAEITPSVSSAESIARYLATTDRAASYHAVYDSDGVIPLLPDRWLAWGVANFNTATWHISAATRAVYWGKDKRWDDAAVGYGAEALARACRDLSIPLQRISANAARSGARGICTHAELDPSRRTDPGAAFPWDRLFAMLGKPLTPRVLQLNFSGGDVLTWQRDLQRYFGGTKPTADGSFGPETYAYTQEWQKRLNLPLSGMVGEGDRAQMNATLAPPPAPAAKHYGRVVLVNDEAGIADRRLGQMFGAAYFIHQGTPRENITADEAFVIGGPTLRSVTEPSRYGRIIELIGADSRETWSKAVGYLAAHPPL